MPSAGMTRADVVHEALRRDRRSSLARSADPFRMPSRSGRALRVGDLAFEAVAPAASGRAEVADDLGLREVDLFDVRRLIADMDDVRPVRRP